MDQTPLIVREAFPERVQVSRLMTPLEQTLRAVQWVDDHVVLLDQNRLPWQTRYVVCRTPNEVARRIRDMTVRGAPAIGVAAAMGMALAAVRSRAKKPDRFLRDLTGAAKALETARPTAVNLSWAVRRIMTKVSGDPHKPIEGLRQVVVEEALRIAQEDVVVNQRLGDYGQALLADGDRVLTYCNAGALATAEWGTALGVIRSAVSKGKAIHVYVAETRPRLQGARLTAFELQHENIPFTLITDNMVGYCMSKAMVDKVIVGADRVAANGDTANKVGTYTLAILARHHGIPLYVAAPTSTIDRNVATGASIPIEERDPEEVTHFSGRRVAPPGVVAINPAFDITPGSLISAIITETGVLPQPLSSSIASLWTRARTRL